MRNNLIQNKKMSILFPFTATIAHLENLYFRTYLCPDTTRGDLEHNFFLADTKSILIRLGESLVESENRKKVNLKVKSHFQITTVFVVFAIFNKHAYTHM